MKARLPKISKKQYNNIREEVAKEMERQSNDMTRRLFKLFCISLNKQFGFGKGRLSRVIAEVESLSKERKKDEVFWSHIDKVLIEQIGVVFQKEDYEEMDK